MKVVLAKVALCCLGDMGGMQVTLIEMALTCCTDGDGVQVVYVALTCYPGSLDDQVA